MFARNLQTKKPCHSYSKLSKRKLLTELTPSLRKVKGWFSIEILLRKQYLSFIFKKYPLTRGGSLYYYFGRKEN